MKKKFKIKLSKKTKKQMHHYLLRRKNVLFEDLNKYEEGSYFYDIVRDELCFLESLMLDIEYYGVK